ncbi:tRNA glutamyl-Q(34) synthetase GluQRS [Jeongeupia naejangsanensis]|uniref:tRNA glutamyl-Q(34) synthetase GluQRS n=1 Tax=Jeongeupia naejangsanensis TaxID=613195 RepID=UPI0027E58225|nr:tRNA glutamyl-Q(34) synthetase GluQRS [Jeongeupia naejangsanensis]
MCKESIALTPASYRGRFAPSPTGDLHLGSLLAAVASYLQAKQAGGSWLLRIEDLDPPRTVPGAAGRILRVLDAYGFEWSGEVLYQSDRHERYLAEIERLKSMGRLYGCACTRKEIAAIAHAGVDGPVYPGTCRGGLPAGVHPRAWRLRVDDVVIGYEDGVQGWQQQDLARLVGDFVLLRADGLVAYQLAVVVDDAEQGITDVVRGADLLDSTPRQIHLQQLLDFPSPGYAHIPVLVNDNGEKLSKQTLAQPLMVDGAATALVTALRLLRQSPPESLLRASVAEVWEWALAHWGMARLAGEKAIAIDA